MEELFDKPPKYQKINLKLEKFYPPAKTIKLAMPTKRVRPQTYEMEVVCKNLTLEESGLKIASQDDLRMIDITPDTPPLMDQ